MKLTIFSWTWYLRYNVDGGWSVRYSVHHVYIMCTSEAQQIPDSHSGEKSGRGHNVDVDISPLHRQGRGSGVRTASLERGGRVRRVYSSDGCTHAAPAHLSPLGCATPPPSHPPPFACLCAPLMHALPPPPLPPLAYLTLRPFDARRSTVLRRLPPAPPAPPAPPPAAPPPALDMNSRSSCW